MGHHHRHPSFFFGLLLVLLGIFWLLDNLNYIDFWHVLDKWWPVLLILLGLDFLIRYNRRWTMPEHHTPPDTSGSGADGPTTPSPSGKKWAFERTNVFGDLTLSFANKPFDGGSVSNVFGDIEIDLRDAVMQPGESVLSVSGVFGDIDIIGLKGIPISVRGNVVFGDIRVFEEKRSGISNQIVNETPGYAQAVSKVRIYALQVFGEVRIR